MAAVVLVGGRARRLGGTAKPLLALAGDTLLGRIRTALREAQASPVVAAGPRLADADLVWAREDPPFGGPVAGIAAAFAGGALDGSAWVLLLAGDLVHPERLVPLLRRESADADDAVEAIVPRAGEQPQWLSGVYRTAAVRRALAELGPVDGASCRALLGGLAIRWIVDEDGVTADIDTPADLDRARAEVDDRAEMGAREETGPGKRSQGSRTRHDREEPHAAARGPRRLGRPAPRALRARRGGPADRPDPRPGP